MNLSSLNNVQKDKIAQFTGVTGSSGSAAIECLHAKNWSLERAIDHFYVTGMSTHPSYMVGTAGGGGGSNHRRGGGRNSNSNNRIDRGAIKQLYTRYADPNNDKILAEGIIQFCTDIGITPDDVVMLVLAERMGADVMGEITKEQFETGLAGLMLDSLEKIKAALPSLRAQIVGHNNNSNNNIGLGSDAESRRRFKEIYNFAYLISREKGQKCVQQDMALEMWSLLLPPQRWPLIHHWCEFLKETHNRAISRDTWVQLVEFIENVPQDGEYTGYDDSGAWPYLVDEFVAWYRGRHGGDDGGVEHMLE
jgi:DCN1-like protein 1/2